MSIRTPALPWPPCTASATVGCHVPARRNAGMVVPWWAQERFHLPSVDPNQIEPTARDSRAISRLSVHWLDW